MLLLATILLLNYYSRSLPTETQKFFGNKFSESVKHSEISENISLRKFPSIRYIHVTYYILYSIYQKDARSIFLYVLHHFAEDFQLFFSSEGQAQRCVHIRMY